MKNKILSSPSKLNSHDSGKKSVIHSSLVKKNKFNLEKNGKPKITKEEIIKDYMKLINSKSQEQIENNFSCLSYNQTNSLSDIDFDLNFKSPIKIEDESENYDFYKNLNGTYTDISNDKQNFDSLRRIIEQDRKKIATLEKENEIHKNLAQKYMEISGRLAEDVIFLRTQLDNFLHYKCKNKIDSNIK
jgi:hypothetical protein